MKKHFVIFVIVFLVTIGFAAANTVLDITGSLNVAENIEDFKIEITNLKINNSDSKTLISKDKQSFTFTGSGNDTINYTVTNYSYQYDANISLICTPNENITVEQISNLPAQSKNSKGITSTNTSAITCTINVEKISRTDYAEDMCKYAEGTEWTFDYTGAEQEFTTPCDGNYKVEAWGAQGEYSTYLGTIDYNYIGGFGAYIKGNIELVENQNIYLYVGGSGKVGGYNGGGVGNGRGGGATDLRLEKGLWNSFNSLKSRIIVAAGGGSAYDRQQEFGGGNGGSGGGLIGMNGTSEHHTNGFGYGYGLGGTQNSGGKSYWQDLGSSGEPSGYRDSYFGSFGVGGPGAAYQAGGGSGYYGGGGEGHGGGGGGSSFISGHNGCDAIAENSTSSNIIHTGQPNHYSGLVFTDTVMIDGAGYNWTNVKGEQTGMPTHDGKSTMTGNAGNGYAKITYLGK